MARGAYSWKFPQHDFLRIEALFVLVLAVLVFIMSWSSGAGEGVMALGLALLFIVIYIVVAKGVKSLHTVEHHYTLHKHHLELVHTRRGRLTHERVNLPDIHHHKLDRFFLGGYIVTKEGKKYVLFFNQRKEMDHFEQQLRKHLQMVKR